MSFLTSPEIVRQLQAEREREFRLDRLARLAENSVQCCRHGMSRFHRIRVALGLAGGSC